METSLGHCGAAINITVPSIIKDMKDESIFVDKKTKFTHVTIGIHIGKFEDSEAHYGTLITPDIDKWINGILEMKLHHGGILKSIFCDPEYEMAMETKKDAEKQALKE